MGKITAWAKACLLGASLALSASAFAGGGDYRARGAWPSDYGVREGWCDRVALNGALRGNFDGLSPKGMGGNDVSPVAVGDVEYVFGGQPPRLDALDAVCLGSSLEMAGSQLVRFASMEGSIIYRQIEAMGHCTNFELRGLGGLGASNVALAHACRQRDGVWIVKAGLRASCGGFECEERLIAPKPHRHHRAKRDRS